MKTWNTPELKELAINSTAGGTEKNKVVDGEIFWDDKGGQWAIHVGKDQNYGH